MDDERRCNHCDRPIKTVMEICAQCWREGHRAVEHCEACRAEALATVERLRVAEHDA